MTNTNTKDNHSQTKRTSLLHLDTNNIQHYHSTESKEPSPSWTSEVPDASAVVDHRLDCHSQVQLSRSLVWKVRVDRDCHSQVLLSRFLVRKVRLDRDCHSQVLLSQFQSWNVPVTEIVKFKTNILQPNSTLFSFHDGKHSILKFTDVLLA